jgi:hypothetical protein
MKLQFLRDILAIIGASAYVLIFLQIGNIIYGEIQTTAARVLHQVAIEVPVGAAIESLAYLTGALLVGLVAKRRGFLYGALVPVMVQVSVYVWYGPLGHTNIPPALRERYPYPFWLYLFPIFGWLIQTGVGGAAGVLLARRALEVTEQNVSRFILAVVLLIPQISAWCYITHAIMWRSRPFLLQTIEFIPATAIFLLFAYTSIRSILKPNVTIPCIA